MAFNCLFQPHLARPFNQQPLQHSLKWFWCLFFFGVAVFFLVVAGVHVVMGWWVGFDFGQMGWEQWLGWWLAGWAWTKSDQTEDIESAFSVDFCSGLLDRTKSDRQRVFQQCSRLLFGEDGVFFLPDRFWVATVGMLAIKY